MSWKKVKLGEVLKQYRQEVLVRDDIAYKQVTISKHDGVCYRGQKIGKEIGRKRQFLIDLKVYPNTLLLVRQGVYEGGIGLAPQEVDGCIATENMPMFSVEGIVPEFLAIVLKSDLFKNEVGKISLTGSAQKSIHERQILEIEIPLPTIDEQNEILRNCEQSQDNISRLSGEFTHQLSLLKKLRQSLLQDAVQGKLVPQDATEEPAAVLLQKIKAEKEALIAAKKLKKDKPLPPVTEAEIPFEVPEGWAWCRLGEISEITGGITLGKRYSEKTISYPYLRVANVQRGFIDLSEVKNLSVPQKEFEKTVLMMNDLLVIEGNGSAKEIGRCAIWHNQIPNCIHQNHIIRVRAEEALMPEFALYVLNSLFGAKQMRELAITTTGLFTLSISKISKLYIPLPPLAEQHRIVQKLETLMATCDALERRIGQSRELAGQLLQTALREALSQSA